MIALFILAFVLGVVPLGGARAGCATLIQSIDLAEQSFQSGSSVDPATLDRLGMLISEIDNAQLLAALQRSGQAASFGRLRNFLTQISVISRSAEASTYAVSSKLTQDFSFARQVIENTCLDSNGNPISAPTDTDNAQDQLEGKRIDSGRGLAQWAFVRRILTDQQIAFLEQGFDLRLLGRVIILLLVITAITVLLHYGLLISRVMRRIRRICAVPATLSYMMTDIDGVITVLGRFGCVFRPDRSTGPDAIEGALAGTYCAITINGQEYGAKLMFDVSEDVRMLFSLPLPPATLKSILTLSNIPVRYDFSVVKPHAKKRRAFGLGRLPKA